MGGERAGLFNLLDTIGNMNNSLKDVSEKMQEATLNIKSLSEKINKSHPKYTELDMEEKIKEIEQLKAELALKCKVLDGLAVDLSNDPNSFSTHLKIKLPLGFKFKEPERFYGDRAIILSIGTKEED